MECLLRLAAQLRRLHHHLSLERQEDSHQERRHRQVEQLGRVPGLRQAPQQRHTEAQRHRYPLHDGSFVLMTRSHSFSCIKEIDI